MAAGKSVSLQVIVLAALFLGGGALGVGLTQWLAPGSFAAQFVGLFTFSLPFAVSMQLWIGSAPVIAVWRALTRGPKQAGHHERAEIPAGSIVFIPTCAGLVTVTNRFAFIAQTPLLCAGRCPRVSASVDCWG